MVREVPYTNIDGRYRPYLEVFFRHSTTHLASAGSFAMIDSGADHTLIPFSVGRSIGLEPPSKGEVLQAVSGIGGNTNFVQRVCHIIVIQPASNEILTFQEPVWWLYPDQTTINQQNELIEKLRAFKEMKNQCIPNTNLFQHFSQEITQATDATLEIQRRLEPGILLGRPFFNNFEFITFCHKDLEEHCSFSYKVIPEKMLKK